MAEALCLLHGEKTAASAPPRPESRRNFGSVSVSALSHWPSLLSRKAVEYLPSN